jgi:hypothetical protein
LTVLEPAGCVLVLLQHALCGLCSCMACLDQSTACWCFCWVIAEGLASGLCLGPSSTRQDCLSPWRLGPLLVGALHLKVQLLLLLCFSTLWEAKGGPFWQGCILVQDSCCHGVWCHQMTNLTANEAQVWSIVISSIWSHNSLSWAKAGRNTLVLGTCTTYNLADEIWGAAPTATAQWGVNTPRWTQVQYRPTH